MKAYIARLFKKASLVLIFIGLVGCVTQSAATPEPLATLQPTHTITASPTPLPTTTTVPPTETPLPTATAIPPTATTIATATATVQPTVTPPPTPTEDATANWVPYADKALNINLLLPTGFSAEHQNGTTTYYNEAGEVALYVREYFNRYNLIEATALIRNIAPSTAHTLPLTDLGPRIGFKVYERGNNLFIKALERILHFTLVAEDERLKAIIDTFSGAAPSIKDITNHNFVTSETWVAELRGGGYTDQTLTAQKRDGSASWEIYFQEGAEGLGYSLNNPLFIDSAERYLYHQRQGVSDGGGTFSGGGDILRFDLTTGESIALDNTGGTGHTLSADNKLMAFTKSPKLREEVMVVHDLATGTQKIFPLGIKGERPSSGAALFSADNQKIAFAAAEDVFGDIWHIGTLDLTSGEIVLYPANGASLFMPVAWQSSIITLQHWDGRENFLNLDTGAITTTANVGKPNLEGLVLGSARGTQEKWVVRGDSARPELAEAAEILSEYESAQLLGQNAIISAAHNGLSYVIRDGDVVVLDGSAETVIKTDRIEHFIFGVVGDWLIVASSEPETIIGAAVGTLSAMALDGSDYQLIDDDMYGTVPIIAPDGSRLFYALNGIAYQWLPTGEKQVMEFGAFRGGGVSPDGNYLALIFNLSTGWELHIYDLHTQQKLVTTPMLPAGGDPLTFPVIWHPASTHVAVDALNPDQTPPFGIRIMAVDGAIQDIIQASSPVFSPDGNWLAAYANQAGPETVIIDWQTGVRHGTPYDGIPRAWAP